MKDKRGFTLIEVISVLVILGLLATIVVTQYATTIRESRHNLNEEQKSRLVEVAKNVSLNNKSCLEIAKDSPDGVKITFDQMKQNGYIANNQLKNLEDSTALNDCVIITWDEAYKKFEYTYSEQANCSRAQSCLVTAESEKVIISSFYMGEGNVNYTNQRNVTYYIRYSTSITAEYCVTLGNEASCDWKKLSTSSTSVSGNLSLPNVENIVHLYIRNSNKNIIASIDDTITVDSAAPTCFWRTPTKSYIRNGSSTEIVLSCNDISGIKNAELLSSAIEVSNSTLVSVSDAVVTTNGNSKEFKFTVYGLEGNGSVNLTLNSGIISDTSGNFNASTYTSGVIQLDNVAPTGNVTIGTGDSNYTNNERITLNFSNVSSDVEKMCVSNSSEGNCSYVSYTPTYNWILSGAEGSKTIYVSLVDRAGNALNKSVNIHLDKISPSCRITPSASNSNIKNGAYIDYTIKCVDENQMASNSAIDTSMILVNNFGDSRVSVSIVDTTVLGTKVRVQAVSGNGKTIVTLKENSVYDAAGNGNRTLDFANVTVDNIPPFNNSIVLNHNSTITHLRGLTVGISSELKNEGGGYYCLSLTNNVNSCNEWVSYSDNGSILVGSSKGTYNVYAFFKDLAGNTTTTSVSDSIKYDPDAISCILVENGNEILINTSNQTILADLPYSPDMINWNNNRVLLKEDDKFGYFSYIKDNNGEINYCELNIEN